MASESLTAALIRGLEAERSAYRVTNASKSAADAPAPLHLLTSLRRLVFADLVRAGLCYLVEVVCTLATPVIIYQLLVWVQSGTPEAGVGVGYIAALGVAS